MVRLDCGAVLKAANVTPSCGPCFAPILCHDRLLLVMCADVAICRVRKLSEAQSRGRYVTIRYYIALWTC